MFDLPLRNSNSVPIQQLENRGPIWVKLRSLSAKLGSPFCPQQRASSARPLRSEKCQEATSRNPGSGGCRSAVALAVKIARRQSVEPPTQGTLSGRGAVYHWKSPTPGIGARRLGIVWPTCHAVG